MWLHRSARRPYRARAWYPLAAFRSLTYLEPLIKIILPPIAVSIELYFDHDDFQYVVWGRQQQRAGLLGVSWGWGGAGTSSCGVWQSPDRGGGGGWHHQRWGVAEPRSCPHSPLQISVLPRGLQVLRSLRHDPYEQLAAHQHL